MGKSNQKNVQRKRNRAVGKCFSRRRRRWFVELSVQLFAERFGLLEGRFVVVRRRRFVQFGGTVVLIVVGIEIRDKFHQHVFFLRLQRQKNLFDQRIFFLQIFELVACRLEIKTNGRQT